MLYAVIAILLFGFLIAIHEFGHFILAKWNGVYVYEFALGMGPKICGFKKGETEYNLRAIPIGGFCQLAGEDLDTDDDKKIPKEKRLQNKKPWQRFLIMLCVCRIAFFVRSRQDLPCDLRRSVDISS